MEEFVLVDFVNSLIQSLEFIDDLWKPVDFLRSIL